PQRVPLLACDGAIPGVSRHPCRFPCFLLLESRLVDCQGNAFVERNVSSAGLMATCLALRFSSSGQTATVSASHARYGFFVRFFFVLPITLSTAAFVLGCNFTHESKSVVALGSPA